MRARDQFLLLGDSIYLCSYIISFLLIVEDGTSFDSVEIRVRDVDEIVGLLVAIASIDLIS